MGGGFQGRLYRILWTIIMILTLILKQIINHSWEGSNDMVLT